jgi:hypothetical protein
VIFILMPKQKQATYEQVERKKDKAVQFPRDVVGDDDKADDFDDMSVGGYAEHKHIQITNPRRDTFMASGNGRTKQDLQDEIDDLTQENQDLQDQLGAITDILNPPEEDEDDHVDGDDVDDDDD